jgi:hypothetical protein
VTQARSPIAVVATMRWATGEVTAVPALALAWTRLAVQVSWAPDAGGPARTDWIPAADVHRVGPDAVRDTLTAPMPPPRNPDRHRRRW